MARARKKAATVGADAPAVVVPEAGARRYRFSRAHTHAGISYVAGDIVSLSEAEAGRIRLYAGADALTDNEG